MYTLYLYCGFIRVRNLPTGRTGVHAGVIVGILSGRARSLFFHLFAVILVKIVGASVESVCVELQMARDSAFAARPVFRMERPERAAFACVGVLDATRMYVRCGEEVKYLSRVCVA